MSAPFRILVLTTSRADFGIYRAVLEAIDAHLALEASLLVTGMHMSEEFGLTVEEVRASGWPIAAEIPCLSPGDGARDIAHSMGAATQAVASVLGDTRTDLLLVLGDRFEMVAGAMAAVPFGLPMAQIHGGEETEGAMDNALRHAMTKLSHLHFCATEMAARRVRQMGELASRVYVTGAPALDSIHALPRLTRTELAAQFDVPETGDFALVTYHPVTLDEEATNREIAALLAALDQLDMAAVFTAANADPAGRRLNARIADYAAARANARLIGHMGATGYYSAMEHSAVMIGNSSSGILEAASLGLAVVNIGDRQRGRERSPNTLDVPGNATAIANAITQARSPAFQARLAGRANIYGDGKSGARIATALADALAGGLGPVKPFHLIGGDKA